MTLREALPEVAAPPAEVPSRIPSPVTTVLKDTRARLADRRDWTKYHLHRDGRSCLLGAVEDAAATRNLQERVVFDLAAVIREDYGNLWRLLSAARDRSRFLVPFLVFAKKTRACATVTTFNDYEGTTHRDVLNVLDRAIERREA